MVWSIISVAPRWSSGYFSNLERRNWKNHIHWLRSNESLYTKLISMIPSTNWEWNDHSQVYIQYSIGRRKTKENFSITKINIKVDAVPLISPGLPLHLTKKAGKAYPTRVALSTSMEDNALQLIGALINLKI